MHSVFNLPQTLSSSLFERLYGKVKLAADQCATRGDSLAARLPFARSPFPQVFFFFYSCTWIRPRSREFFARSRFIALEVRIVKWFHYCLFTFGFECFRRYCAIAHTPHKRKSSERQPQTRVVCQYFSCGLPTLV